MKYRTSEIIVGAFTLAGLVILIGVTVHLKSSVFFTRKDYRVTALFRDAKRLEEGAPVLVYGVVRGDVRKIEATGSVKYPVRVVMMLISGTVLHEGARARIISAGLVGETQVNIEDGPPTGPPLPDEPEERIIYGVTTMDISEALDGAGEVIAHLQDSVAALSEILGSEKNQQALSTILESASSITLKIDQVLGASGGDIGAAIRNIRLATDQLTTTIMHINETVETVSRDITQASGDLSATIADLRTSAGTLLERLETVAGTLDDTLRDANALIGTAQAILAENQDDTRRVIAGASSTTLHLSRILERIDRGQDTVAQLLLGQDSFADLTASLDTLKNSLARVERLLAGIDRWLTGTDARQRPPDILYHNEAPAERTQ